MSADSTEPASASAESTFPPTQPDATQQQDSIFTIDTKQQPSSNDTLEMSNEADRDLDAEIDRHPDAGTQSQQLQTGSDSMNMDGSSDLPPTHSQVVETSGVPSHPAVIEARIPQKKDASLREFLGKMDDYAPLIPDAVTDYYLTVAGLPPPPETDRRLARLLALATQKFVADVAADAYQYSRIRSTNTTSNNPLTGLGGAAGFGMMNMPGGGGGGEGEGGGSKGKKDAGKSQPLGGPRAGYGGGGAGGGQGRTVLTMEDLGMAVGEYGVNIKRGEFYR